MPIFQDDLGKIRETPSTKQSRPPLSESLLNEETGSLIKRKASEESIRTELCEGPVLDSPPTDKKGSLDSDYQFPSNGTSERTELIERPKRVDNHAPWLPDRNESPFHYYDQTPYITAPIPSLLQPSPEMLETHRVPGSALESMRAGLQIERPRSALHSGDFTQGPRGTARDGHNLLGERSGLTRDLSSSPWLSISPPGNFSPFQLNPRFPPPDAFTSAHSRSRAPSLSSSYASSFVLKPPTSPLVQSESNEDFDLSSRMDPIDITSGLQRNPRRHTLQMINSFQSSQSLLSSSSSSRPMPHLRRDSTYPYQAHQPRRSLTTNQMPHPTSSPQTPMFSGGRRPSYASDVSPLHHATMVGSYEESIIRGRMSTNPSRPLDFVAQIGVLGLGKSVFYSYETTSHGRVAKAEDGPSPYVGQIDLENTLQNPDEARDVRRKRISASMSRSTVDDSDMVDGPATSQLSEREIRRSEKQKRRATSPRAPPGGSYRIPEKGQLQIIIKNPNKTAVKLFLVPYDLAGMEPGTKTFIRQRSYSGGPIIDSALSSTQQVPASSVLDRPTLRYLVHLHICSPSRGRFYLYKSIRIVFANRVPDGKEKLRNEISIPEPRFSVYKPGRESASGLAVNSTAGASLAAEKAYRRRSSGFPLAGPVRTHDTMDRITNALETGFGGGSGHVYGQEISTTPAQPIPFSLYQKPARSEESPNPVEDLHSPTSSKSSQPPGSRDSSMQMSWTSNSTEIGGYDKLSKGDVGYGGNLFAAPSPDGKQVAESLLAKKLKDLGVGTSSQQDHMDGI